ncbi:hypothetical protein NM688_g1001 [Phlebia brevispora]|uniref:Uncharacterized protein n=1 Tax=Phlebia brevispora TaxID=194682 RepID=A0ACC1TCZ3_9APHY|nr:hypothetical protein NM688_g1001 [Phlebia brevispora]
MVRGSSIRRDRNGELQRPYSPTPPSTRTPNESIEQREEQSSLTARRKSHRRDRDRHSTTRELLRTLLNEETETKRAHRLLNTVISKLDAETQRAREAEKRALELAARFKVVNEARLAAQQELSRVNEELRLYKDLEAQRDDAEAVAARARTQAHRLKEEKVAYRAREEGRQEGYKEGLQRGLEQARYARLREIDDNLEEDVEESAGRGRASSLEELAVRNLPSPTTNGPELVSPAPQHPIPPLSEQPASRFHEHGLGRTPSFGHADLRDWAEEEPKVIRPTSMAGPPERHAPPDGYIPPIDENNHVQIPPPFALDNTPRASSQPLPAPPPGQFHINRPQTDPMSTRGYASSLDSVPASIQSTAISSFDIVTNPPDRLSTIREASMEFSPESHTQAIPEPLVFPSGPSHTRDDGWGARTESEGTRTPRSHRSRRSIDRESVDRGNRSRTPSFVAPVPVVDAQPQVDSRIHHANAVPPPPVVQPEMFQPPAAQPPLMQSPYHPPSAEEQIRYIPPPRAPFVNNPATNMVANPLRPPSAPSRESSRSRRSLATGDDSFIPIDIESPKRRRPPQSRPRKDRTVQSCPRYIRHPPLPVQSPRFQQRIIPMVPTEPNSPSMPRLPSVGMLPAEMPGGMPGNIPVIPGGTVGGMPPIPGGGAPFTGGPPPGFVATPSAAPAPNLPPSPMQSTPRLFAGPNKAPLYPRRQSSLSSSSGDSDVPSIGKHGRSYSEGVRSDTPGGAIRPPSSSASSRGPRQAFYSGLPTQASLHNTPPVVIPGSVQIPVNFSPRSTASGAPPNAETAGNTPGFTSRQMPNPAPALKRTSSNSSAGSRTSSLREQFGEFRSRGYVDPAFLASAEDLTALSPNTAANTHANAGNRSQTSIPDVLRPGSRASSFR